VHGKKSRVLVHIGSVDAPVTIAEIKRCDRGVRVSEAGRVARARMGMGDGPLRLMVDEAKKQAVKLLLLQIPREVMEQQAADKGDVQFFELAYLT